MANPGDLTVALRLQADVAEAIKRLGEVEAALGRIEQADTAGATGKADGLAQANKEVAQAANAAATAQEQLAVSAAAPANVGTLEQANEQLRRMADKAAAAAAAQQQLSAAAAQTAPAKVDGLAQADREVAAAAKTAAAAQQQLNTATARAAQGVAQVGMSAKQSAQAMRQLPMQITDITTSLASGMPVWMVAIQQGGQIRDSFGGIGPAMKAVASTITVARVAMAGAVGAAVALAVAYKQGSDESARLANALVLTGNYAGTSAGQMNAMAAAIDQVSTGTRGQAAQALEALAASGKIAAGSMEAIATAAVDMSNATGRSIQDVVAEFVKLADEPASAAAKLNEQYHFLTAAVFEQIRALEEQGDKEAAAELAQSAYAEALKTRAAKAEENLGTLERAWNAVGRAAGEAWDGMLNLGREESFETKLKAAREQLARGVSGWDKFVGFLSGDTPDPALEVRVLEAAIEARDQRAEEAGKSARAQAEATKAIDAVAKANAAALTPQQRLNKALAEYRDNLAKIRATNPQSALLDPAQIAQTEAALRERILPKTRTPRTKADPVETAYQSQLQALTLARAEAEQRLANAKDGVAAAEERVTTRLEAWLTVNRNALKLNEQQVATLRDLAAQTDAAAKATGALQETQKRDERIDAGLADVRARARQIAGDTAGAAIAQVEERWKKLRQDLNEAGDLAGVIELDVLIDKESARAQLTELQRDVERIFADQSRAEQSLQLEVTAGVTGEIDARRRVLDLHRETADRVAALIPEMERLAAVTGDARLGAGIEDLKLKVAELRLHADELKNVFGETFGESLSQALANIAKGTEDLGGAVRGFLLDLAEGMAQWAAQQLAMEAQARLLAALRGAAGTAEAGEGAVAGAAGAAGAVADTAATAAGTAAQAAHTAATVADTAAATASTAAGTAAATALAALSTAAGTAASALAATAASAGGAKAGGILKALGFADGGYTGDGGKYQPAGVVHKGEFVTRSEVTGQPGALAFLSDFNRHGMALFGFRGYAEGGLVTAPGVSAPALRPAALAQPQAAGATVHNRQNFVLVDDPARIAEAAFNSRAGEEGLVVLLSRDPAKFRSILQL